MIQFSLSNQKVRQAATWLLIATFFVPAFVLPQSFIFPFIVPKILLFRTLVVLLIGAYLLLYRSQPEKYGPEGSFLTYAVLVFFASFAISTFVGVDWYRSVWDNHERMLGLFTFAHYTAYYLILTTLVREWKEWRIYLIAFLLAGCIPMAIGVWQRIHPEFLLNQGAGRVSATLGNPIYFGGYGLFLACVGYILFIKERITWVRVAAGLAGILGVIGIFISGTRGTMVGFFIGIFVLLLTYAIGYRANQKIRRVMWAACAGSVLLVGILYLCRDTALVSAAPALSRLFHTHVSDATAGTRFMAWKIAIIAWKNKPVFGWGPNNYYYAFNTYYLPQFLLSGWSETWFDNAHNVLMNSLATQGVVGLIAYLSLFGVSGWSLVRAYRKKQTDIHVAAIGIGFLVAHFVHNFFVFEDPTSYLYFFFFLAFINSMTLAPSADDVKSVGSHAASLPFVIAVALMCVTAIYLTDGLPAIANKATLKSLIYLNTDPAQAFAFYDEAINARSPHVDDIRVDFSRSAINLIPAYVNAKRNEDAMTLIRLSYDGLKDDMLLHPLDIRIHIQLASLLQVWAQYTQNKQLLIEAGQVLEDALKKSPKRQQLQYMLSTNYLALGDKEKAAALLQQAIDNEPRIGESWWRLVVTYSESKQFDKALAVIKDAQAKDIHFDEQGQRIIKQIQQQIASSTPPGKK